MNIRKIRKFYRHDIKQLDWVTIAIVVMSFLLGVVTLIALVVLLRGAILFGII